jgi:hypothetical protein
MPTHVQSTLLELVSTLTSFMNSDDEVVALVASLVNSGRVRLCGNFAGATIEVVSSYPSTPQPRLLLS